MLEIGASLKSATSGFAKSRVLAVFGICCPLSGTNLIFLTASVTDECAKIELFAKNMECQASEVGGEAVFP